jgi:hypothetical protein
MITCSECERELGTGDLCRICTFHSLMQERSDARNALNRIVEALKNYPDDTSDVTPEENLLRRVRKFAADALKGDKKCTASKTIVLMDQDGDAFMAEMRSWNWILGRLPNLSARNREEQLVKAYVDYRDFPWDVYAVEYWLHQGD